MTAASAFLKKKTILLSECAELSLGYSFRGRIESTPAGSYLVIQMRDLSADQRVDMEHAIRSDDHGFTSTHYLESGDLIFRARGTNTTAAIVAEIPDRTALASPLIRIRAKRDFIDPRFLQWFINLPASQLFLASGSQGSLVKMVSIEHLARLEIVLLSMEEQRRVVELADICSREAFILRKLADLSEIRTRLMLSEFVFGKDRSEHDD
jgi:hypothetical protein